MPYCINPNCLIRDNLNGAEICLCCGNQLHINDLYWLVEPLRPLNQSPRPEVFKVYARGTPKVLKFIKSNELSDINRFEQEARILISLRHPGMPKADADAYFSYTLDNGRILHCLVMEEIEGQNLEDWLQENGPISQDLALTWLRELAEILDYVHQSGFSHRDINPSNILRKPNGQLVLIDFGVAKQVTDREGDEPPGTVVYASGYTAVEQLEGRSVPQSDFFALGRTFVHLLTGSHPHSFVNSETGQLTWRQSLQQEVSDELANFIDELMAPAVQDRPNNTEAIQQRIQQISDNISYQEQNVDSARVLLSDRSQDTSFAQELRGALAAEQAVVIIEAQSSDEKINDYDCFLLLVSSHSASNIVMEEIERTRQLCDARLDRKPVIMLVHVGSPMSLPLNHPLHNNLQGIPQREWPQTDASTLVQEILELLEVEQPPVPEVNPGSLGQFLQNVSSLNLSRNWLLTYIGEDQLLKLGALVNDLVNKGERRIQSGYSYWGVGPVQMWDRACNDPTYHMSKNIAKFPHYAKQLAHFVDKERYNFVSLGVGEGRKDRSILSNFFNRNGSTQAREDFLYIPVDMSLDMLRIAVEKIQETNPLPLHCCVAIQRDIETHKGMQEIAYIAQSLGSQKPILYGFIGNTIANVDNPKQVLDNIVNVMRAEDLLLFEAQIINASALESQQRQETMNRVKKEYYASGPFHRFAVSALLQNTDLTIEPTERNSSYVVDVSLHQWEYGQVVQIDCFFENNTDRSLYMTLVNEQSVELDKKERIRLYRSRKFPQPTLQNFVQASGLSILGKNDSLSGEDTGFMVMMLKRQN